MNFEQFRILEMKVGSHLYGTSTPDSDVDFSGVFVAPREFYLGLDKVEEVDLSIVSKKENGRNNKDAVDRKLYELRKFMSLAMMNNPNIIEQLFVEREQLVYSDLLGTKLLLHRHIFPYKGCYDKFIGYAISQKKKMIIKRDNMFDILQGIEFFEKVDDKQHTYVVELSWEFLKLNKRIRDTGQHYNIGDMSIQKNDTVKQALRKLVDRSSRFSSRFEDFISKTGYDTKFASHLIRLLIEGRDLLTHGKLVFPLKDRELILDIKSGKYSIEEVLEMAQDFEDSMRGAKEKSELPSKPNKKKIEKLLIEIIEESWNQ